MNRYALIIEGVVTNIALWDGASSWDHGCDAVILIEEGQKVGVGSDWDGTNFTEPPYGVTA